MLSEKLLGDVSKDSGLSQSRERAHSSILDTGEEYSRVMNTDLMALKSLLADCGSTSVSHLR